MNNYHAYNYSDDTGDDLPYYEGDIDIYLEEDSTDGDGYDMVADITVGNSHIDDSSGNLFPSKVSFSLLVSVPDVDKHVIFPEHKAMYHRLQESVTGIDWNKEFQRLYLKDKDIEEDADEDKTTEERGDNSSNDNDIGDDSINIGYGIVEIEFKRTIELRKLAMKFAEVASEIGVIIIKELFLSDHLKTIPPYEAGGVAGGEKYLACGIFFKLSRDWFGLYGGESYSMKAAEHELKGTMAYLDCRVEGLHLPLMALIRFRGYSLLAQSLLPINSSTLCYGTADSWYGCWLFLYNNNETALTHKLKLAAKILNIKPHYVSTRDKVQKEMMYTAADMEGHKGNDGKFYLIDTARVFPPTAHPKYDRHRKMVPKPSGAHLYRLFRAEFVKKNETPLSSDAFSRFGRCKYSDNSKVHNSEVFRATKTLLHKVIPAFAKYLDNRSKSPTSAPLTTTASPPYTFSYPTIPTIDTDSSNIMSSINSLSSMGSLHSMDSIGSLDSISSSIDSLSSINSFSSMISMGSISNYRKEEEERKENIISISSTNTDILSTNINVDILETEIRELLAEIHMRGINMRYLIQIFELVKTERVKIYLMTEAIARVLKHLLEDRWRQLQSSQPQLYKKEVVDFFSLVFGYSEKSKKFWKTNIYQSLLIRFPPSDISSSRCYHCVDSNPYLPHHFVDKILLYRRATALLGIQHTFKQYRDVKYNKTATNSDINDDKFAHSYSPTYHELEEALENNNPFSNGDEINLFPRVKHIHRISFEEGTALTRMGESKTGEEARQLFKLADEKFKEAVQIKPSNVRALYNWAFSLSKQAQLETGEEAKRLWDEVYDKYAMCLVLHPHDCTALWKWGTALMLQADHMVNNNNLDDSGGSNNGDENNSIFRMSLYALACSKLNKAVSLLPIPTHFGCCYNAGNAYLTYARLLEKQYLDKMKTSNSNDNDTNDTNDNRSTNNEFTQIEPLTKVIDALKQAIQHFKLSLNTNNTSVFALQNLAVSYATLARVVIVYRSNLLHIELLDLDGDNLFNECYQCYKTAHTLERGNHVVLSSWANTLFRHAILRNAENFYQSLSLLGQSAAQYYRVMLLIIPLVYYNYQYNMDNNHVDNDIDQGDEIGNNENKTSKALSSPISLYFQMTVHRYCNVLVRWCMILQHELKDDPFADLSLWDLFLEKTNAFVTKLFEHLRRIESIDNNSSSSNNNTNHNNNIIISSNSSSCRGNNDYTSTNNSYYNILLHGLKFIHGVIDNISLNNANGIERKNRRRNKDSKDKIYGTRHRLTGRPRKDRKRSKDGTKKEERGRIDRRKKGLGGTKKGRDNKSRKSGDENKVNEGERTREKREKKKKIKNRGDNSNTSRYSKENGQRERKKKRDQDGVGNGNKGRNGTKDSERIKKKGRMKKERMVEGRGTKNRNNGEKSSRNRQHGTKWSELQTGIEELIDYLENNEALLSQTTFSQDSSYSPSLSSSTGENLSPLNSSENFFGTGQDNLGYSDNAIQNYTSKLKDENNDVKSTLKKSISHSDLPGKWITLNFNNSLLYSYHNNEEKYNTEEEDVITESDFVLKNVVGKCRNGLVFSVYFNSNKFALKFRLKKELPSFPISSYPKLTSLSSSSIPSNTPKSPVVPSTPTRSSSLAQSSPIIPLSALPTPHPHLYLYQHPTLVPIRYMFHTSTKLYYMWKYEPHECQLLSYVKAFAPYEYSSMKEEKSVTTNNGHIYPVSLSKPLTHNQLTHYVSQLVSLFSYIQHTGNIYNDFHPRNVVLSSTYHQLIVFHHYEPSYVKNTTNLNNNYNEDENISFSSLVQHYSLLSPSLLAPELLSPHHMSKDKNNSDDNTYNIKNIIFAPMWWALGIYLYNCYMGHHPYHYEKSNDKSKLYESITTSTPSVEVLHPHVQSLLLRLLDTSPSSRLQFVSTIQKHRLFAHVNWESLLQEKRVGYSNINNSDVINNVNTEGEGSGITRNKKGDDNNIDPFGTLLAPNYCDELAGGTFING